jgi:CrcB protein
MANILWIGLGGFLGANARFWLGSLVNRWLGTGFPWATGLVNISGAFLIGIIATLFVDRAVDNEALRLFLIVGILGGYTTFSSYMWEAITLMEENRWLPAIAYLVASNLLGIAACVVGVMIARRWV